MRVFAKIDFSKGVVCVKRLGFTLAEVLITLGIIGVVAAILLTRHILMMKMLNF